MKILLVAEGEHELGAPGGDSSLETLCRRLLEIDAEFHRMTVRDPAVRVHIQRGKSDGYEKRAVAWLGYADRNGFDALIMLVDHDGDTRRSAQLGLAQDNLLFGIRRAFGVAVRTFDAWMLADEKALSAALKSTARRQKSPETLRDPKAICRQLVADCLPDGSRLQEVYAAIAAETDLEIVGDRCARGFRPFAEKVRAIPADHPKN